MNIDESRLTFTIIPPLLDKCVLLFLATFLRCYQKRSVTELYEHSKGELNAENQGPDELSFNASVAAACASS